MTASVDWSEVSAELLPTLLENPTEVISSLSHFITLLHNVFDFTSPIRLLQQVQELM